MPSRRQPSRERWEAYYSGHVQSVGFRETARRLAERLDVTGFVRNLADGRVELVAEGEPAKLQRLMNAIAESLGSRIHEVKVDARPALDQFSAFDVRR